MKVPPNVQKLCDYINQKAPGHEKEFLTMLLVFAQQMKDQQKEGGKND